MEDFESEQEDESHTIPDDVESRNPQQGEPGTSQDEINIGPQFSPFIRLLEKEDHYQGQGSKNTQDEECISQ